MKTSEAAEMLCVSPSTLRTWEARHGFPKPSRTLGRHRIYDRTEILALRSALESGLSVASAIEKVRAHLGIDESLLDVAFRLFQREQADHAMEVVLGVRQFETAITDVLLPALDATRDRAGETSAVWGFAIRWAEEWLHRQRRLAPQPSRPLSLLVGDATGAALDLDRPPLAALELFCARAGARVLTLPVHATSGLRDAAAGVNVVLLAGSRAPLEQQTRWLNAVGVAAGPLPLLFFRTRRGNARELPHDPLRARDELLLQFNAAALVSLAEHSRKTGVARR
jgi:DNA-binding transcriptional MerR regulator